MTDYYKLYFGDGFKSLQCLGNFDNADDAMKSDLTYLTHFSGISVCVNKSDLEALKEQINEALKVK